MISFLQRFKNAIIIGLVLIAAFIAYSIFFKPDSGGALTVESGSGVGAPVDQALISLLLELKSITLDPSIFEDARFRALQDFSQEIVAEPVGRENPFAPLSP